MSPQQKILIKNSWQRIQNVEPAMIGEVFYARLFQDAPGVQHLFSHSRAEQGRKLMAMLSLLMEKLDREDAFCADLRELALRHVAYGVKERHYESVGKALLWTFRIALGEEWTPEAESAWNAWYALLAQTMKDAAYPPKLEEPPLPAAAK